MRRLAFVLVLAAAAVIGTAAVALRQRTADAPPVPRPRAEAPRPTATPAGRKRRRPPRARCRAGVAGCVAVRGAVVYVERVDPDGDGDLHVVVLAGRVTAPGITAIDVAKQLRPKRDPRVGDLVAAAGPVEKGSVGQSQIRAVVFRVRPA